MGSKIMITLFKQLISFLCFLCLVIGIPLAGSDTSKDTKLIEEKFFGSEVEFKTTFQASFIFSHTFKGKRISGETYSSIIPETKLDYALHNHDATVALCMEQTVRAYFEVWGTLDSSKVINFHDLRYALGTRQMEANGNCNVIILKNSKKVLEPKENYKHYAINQQYFLPSQKVYFDGNNYYIPECSFRLIIPKQNTITSYQLLYTIVATEDTTANEDRIQSKVKISDLRYRITIESLK